jgi:hypothetical protein
VTFDSFKLQIALGAAFEHREPAAKEMTLPANRTALHATAQ